MIRELFLDLPGAGEGAAASLLLLSDTPGDDLRHHARLHHAVHLAPGDAGGAVRVEVVGTGEVLARLEVEGARWDALGRALAGNAGRWILGLGAEADGAWIQVLEVLPYLPPGSEPPAADPRGLHAAARRARAAGDAAATERALFALLELLPNHVDALLDLFELDPTGPLAVPALARATRLAADLPRVAAARARLAEGGEDVVARLERRVADIDLTRPLRSQWAGCLGTPRDRLDPLTRTGVYAAFLRAGHADGRLEGWEEALALELAAALGLDAAERREACRRAADDLEISGGPGGELDREDLFRRLVGAALADGVVEPQEVQLLEKVREVLGLAAGWAREVLRTEASGELRAGKVRRFLAAPTDPAAREELLEDLFLGRNTLRPGAAQVYADLLDDVRTAHPAGLPGMLRPVAEASRYSAPLSRAVARAAGAVARGGAPGRARALEVAGANRADAAILGAIAEALGEELERDPDREAVLGDLRLLQALQPRLRKVREVLGAALPSGVLATSPEGSEGSGASAVSADALARLREAAARGRKLEVLEGLDALESLDGEPGELRRRLDEARLEAVLAASFHGWVDLLDACLLEDTDAGFVGASSGALWQDVLLRLAALDLAFRRGDAAAQEVFRAQIAERMDAGEMPVARRRYLQRVLRRYRSGRSPTD